jgi:hypothetical protein
MLFEETTIKRIVHLFRESAYGSEIIVQPNLPSPASGFSVVTFCPDNELAVDMEYDELNELVACGFLESKAVPDRRTAVRVCYRLPDKAHLVRDRVMALLDVREVYDGILPVDVTDGGTMCRAVVEGINKRIEAIVKQYVEAQK